ncbi:MAG: hypothetical protein ABW168_00355 [Sedimenticola sp.]
MFNWILDFEFNSVLGIILYWVPLSLCVYGYTIRTWFNYQKDTKGREDDNFYSPTDTVGTLIGRGIATLMPVANLWAATFDVAPEVFRRLFSFLGKVFDQPLVPKKKTQDITQA